MSRLILPEPPDELKELSEALCRIIRREIRDEGMIPFSRFMELALYQPGLGYYSAGLHKLGEKGDFVTSPELGPLFAACLARQVAESAGTLGEYDLLEIGAGSGALAAGLLGSLDEDTLPRRYRILERSADLREVQRTRLASEAPEHLDRVEWLDRPPQAPWRGVLIANEVLDALTVERFQVSGNAFEQLCVDLDGNAFRWAARPAPPELANTCSRLVGESMNIPDQFGQGYRSEINLLLPNWLQAVTAEMTRGLALFMDYGYPRAEYYLPQRVDGTLMCHYRHRAHDDVFFWPGLQDITAWVDFTALAEAADDCGLEVEGYCSQAMFLLACGLDRVLPELAAKSADDGMALQAEARQLTLPGMMGERFKVMGLGRGLDTLPSGFSLQDSRHRL